MTGTTDTDLVVAHLDAALAELLAARVAASQNAPEPALPEEALDLALRGHEGHQTARRAFSEALATVGAALGEQSRNLGFELESAVNALVVQACEVGWALAWTAAAAPRRQP